MSWPMQEEQGLYMFTFGAIDTDICSSHLFNWLIVHVTSDQAKIMKCLIVGLQINRS